MDVHQQRIKNELKAEGVSRFGMRKFAINYLPKLIHEDEHIKGVIYGRYHEEGGTSFNEGMLVATDLKMIFLDHKPGYTKSEVLSYDVLAGIERTTAIFSSIALHTRLGDFRIRYANPKCAEIFFDYVEKRRLESRAVIGEPADARAYVT